MTLPPACDVPNDAGKKIDKPKPSRSSLVSRNVTVSGHRTSIRLEPEMWSGLAEICRRERVIMHEVCTAVATRKQENSSLTAAIRVFVMAYFRAAATEDGHSKAGHGYGSIMAVPAAAVAVPRPAASGTLAFTISAGKLNGTRRY
jgi:predicted DNA-binding ribbon-helix-helix protein